MKLLFPAVAAVAVLSGCAYVPYDPYGAGYAAAPSPYYAPGYAAPAPYYAPGYAAAPYYGPSISFGAVIGSGGYRHGYHRRDWHGGYRR